MDARRRKTKHRILIGWDVFVLFGAFCWLFGDDMGMIPYAQGLIGAVLTPLSIMWLVHDIDRTNPLALENKGE